jgi:hypothetical protein
VILVVRGILDHGGEEMSGKWRKLLPKKLEFIAFTKC